MKISRLCLLAASLAAVLTVTGCDDKKTATPAAQASAAKTYNIGVVQLVEHQALDAANKGFVDGLASKGFVEGKNVKFDFQNAQADQSNLRNIATRFTGNKVDLIGAIATPAAQTMANATNKIPIVATAVTDFEIAKLVKSNDKPGTNVTGSSDMAPISSLLDVINVRDSCFANVEIVLLGFFFEDLNLTFGIDFAGGVHHTDVFGVRINFDDQFQ